MIYDNCNVSVMSLGYKAMIYNGRCQYRILQRDFVTPMAGSIATGETTTIEVLIPFREYIQDAHILILAPDKLPRCKAVVRNVEQLPYVHITRIIATLSSQ